MLYALYNLHVCQTKALPTPRLVVDTLMVLIQDSRDTTPRECVDDVDADAEADADADADAEGEET